MKHFLEGLVVGVAVTLLVQHYRTWILAKLGITFPPKPPQP